MSTSNIDTLLDLWAANLFQHDDHPPYADHNHLYETIDAMPLGDVPWQSFTMKYNGNLPEGPLPTWMTDEFQVWFWDPRTIVHNMLANPEFDGKIDYSPYRDFDANGERQYQDFMSGDWAWKHAVSQLEIDLTSHTHSFKDIITDDPNTHGTMFVPIILGSDKTTVSVGTGNNEYYPLYASIGNVHNNVHRAHHNALALVGFLSIPKCEPVLYFLSNITELWYSR
jgi:hypothetical protein